VRRFYEFRTLPGQWYGELKETRIANNPLFQLDNCLNTNRAGSMSEAVLKGPFPPLTPEGEISVSIQSTAPSGEEGTVKRKQTF
jgi:hypothetical protein